MELVEIGFSKAALGDFQEADCLKLFKIRANTALPCPHVVCEFGLTRKTAIIVPSVFK